MENMLTFEIEADELEIFLEDVNDHLQAMEAGILSMEQGIDQDTLNTTFRAAHTIKAVAATVGHRQMADLTHTLETLFDAMREGSVVPSQTMTDELLLAIDVLKALRDEVVTRESSGLEVADFLTRLRMLTEGSDGQEPQEQEQERDTSLPEPSLLTPEQETLISECRQDGHEIFQVQAVMRADAFAQSARLLQAAMALAEVGDIITQQPAQADLTEGRHSGRLWLVLATRADADTVEEILSYISDLAEFRVQPYQPEPQAPTHSPKPSSSKLPQSPASPNGPTSETVRISVERLDSLMNLVGELVTDRTRLTQINDMLHAQYGASEVGRSNGAIGALSDMTTHFERVVDQLQEEVMQARMLPIANLFQKLPRLVRDVARAGGKQVDLVIEGQDTELDRSIIEVIGDPLIHLLRNAVDHGIESPQERVAAGKPPAGTIWLTAAHEEGHIVITVRDDGQGIDPERTRRAAVTRGLMSEEQVAQLDDDAAVNLVFQPNLSTAEQVTDISGRGMGLDVVRTNVKKLSGMVMVESEVGHGATFRVTLPLTLAIVQAMMIDQGDAVFAIPLSSIVETLYLADVKGSSVKGKPVIHWRDQALPIVDLGQFFAQSDENRVSGQAVVVVAWGKLQVGLVVDRLIGKQEIVIKSLGSFIGSVPALSGCTILGDGRIALIIEISGLINECLKAQREAIAI